MLSYLRSIFAIVLCVFQHRRSFGNFLQFFFDKIWFRFISVNTFLTQKYILSFININFLVKQWRKFNFLAVFFELLQKFKDFINYKDYNGKIRSKSIILCSVFIKKRSIRNRFNPVKKWENQVIWQLMWFSSFWTMTQEIIMSPG